MSLDYGGRQYQSHVSSPQSVCSTFTFVLLSLTCFPGGSAAATAFVLPSELKAGKDKRSRGKASQKRMASEDEPFLGDRVLANSIDFLAEAIVIREFLYACTEGDPGRVYEAMKVSTSIR